MVDALQEQALSTRLGIPLLYGVDSVHGHANLNGATVFPHNIGLGATRDVQARGADRAHHRRGDPGHGSAVDLRAVRLRGSRRPLGPHLRVIRGEPAARGTDGGDHRRGSKVGRAVATSTEPDRVLATAKHFAGDGLTTFGSAAGDYTIDQGITEVSHQEFWRNALAPYVPAVQRYDVGSVMPSFSSVDWTEDGLGNPLKMHAQDELINGVLKDDLGFEGFVISDWRAIHQIPGDYATQVAISVNAGVDMFMEPFSGDPSGIRSSSRPSPSW